MSYDHHDEQAVTLAEWLWPDRYVGDLSKAEWVRVYDGLLHPEQFLSADEVAEYERCKQSVVDARLSANANEGQRFIG